MKWLEIIELRTSENNSEAAIKELARLINEINQKNQNKGVTLYLKAYLKTDISLHIRHHEDHIPQGGSDLGLNIAASLKVYGLVNHQLWQEVFIN